jgi:Ca-activated chloride channel family protein
MKKRQLNIILVFLALAQFAFAQQTDEEKKPPLTRILFIFDASQSMYGRWQSDTKMNMAQQMMSNLLDSLRYVENIELALRVFGHQRNYPPQDCSDTRLEVPFEPDNTRKIKKKINEITPKGTTPIAFSLQESEHDFPDCEDCRNIIILITDGIEECIGDPCDVSAALQRKGVVLKPFVIGIGHDFRSSFECVGSYFDASSEHAFTTALNAVITQALQRTTLQVNLLDTWGNPTETNVNMTFYDRISGLPRYNFIHTLNNAGNPDTLIIDPIPVYDIVIHTTPPVRIDSVVLEPELHNTIVAKTPQGSLNLMVRGNDRLLRSIPIMIRAQDPHETINVQMVGENKRYLTGYYNLEVLSLPRLQIPNIEISQDAVTNVEIPLPGIVVINKSIPGYGSLYVVKNRNQSWIYDLRDNLLQESLILMPGDYLIVYRSKFSNRSIFTIERHFTIRSGETVNLRIF